MFYTPIYFVITSLDAIFFETEFILIVLQNPWLLLHEKLYVLVHDEAY